MTRERGLGMDFFDATLHCSLSDECQPIPIRHRSARTFPTGLAELVDRAVRKRVDDRFADALSMLEAIKAIPGGIQTGV